VNGGLANVYLRTRKEEVHRDMHDDPIHDDVPRRMQDILCDLLCLKPEEVRPESLLLDDLDLDSLGFIELAFAVEKTFGVDFPDVKATEETFGALVPDALTKIESMGGNTTLFEYIKQEAIRALFDEPDATDILAPHTREDLFRAQTAATLARAVGGRVPDGLDPATSITTLHLSDLFRLLTVGIMARYVEYLVASQTAPPRTCMAAAAPWS
jgi:acyl carrier protein